MFIDFIYLYIFLAGGLISFILCKLFFSTKFKSSLALKIGLTIFCPIVYIAFFCLIAMKNFDRYDVELAFSIMFLPFGILQSLLTCIIVLFWGKVDR